MANARRYFGIYTMTVTAALLISGLYRFSSTEHQLLHISSTMMDGAIVWAADKMLIIGIVPMVMIAYNNILKNAEYRAQIVTRYHSRWHLWINQEKRILILSMGTMLTLMVFSGLFAWLLNEGRTVVNLEEAFLLPNDSYLGKTLLQMGMIQGDTNIHLNYFLFCLMVWAINSLEMFVIVLISNGIEWIFHSKIWSVILPYSFCIIIGVNPQAGRSYGMGLFRGIKSSAVDFYQELLNPTTFISRILVILAIVLIVNSLAVSFVKKRDL